MRISHKPLHSSLGQALRKKPKKGRKHWSVLERQATPKVPPYQPLLQESFFRGTAFIEAAVGAGTSTTTAGHKDLSDHLNPTQQPSEAMPRRQIEEKELLKSGRLARELRSGRSTHNNNVCKQTIFSIKKLLKFYTDNNVL